MVILIISISRNKMIYLYIVSYHLNRCSKLNHQSSHHMYFIYHKCNINPLYKFHFNNKLYHLSLHKIHNVIHIKCFILHLLVLLNDINKVLHIFINPYILLSLMMNCGNIMDHFLYIYLHKHYFNYNLLHRINHQEYNIKRRPFL